MTTTDIWMLPVEQRLVAFVERWEELAEHMGDRTVSERFEMNEIADAVMPALIAAWKAGGQ